MEPIKPSSGQDGPDEGDVAASCVVCGTTDTLETYSVGQTATGGGQRDATQILLCDSHALFVQAYDSNADTSDHEGVGYQLLHQETQKITARVPKPLLEALDEIAGNRGQTRSELIRDFFEQSIRAAETEAELDDLLYRLADLQAQNRQLTQALDEQYAQSDPEHAESGTAERSADVEFLKQRIERLESLLEQTIDKL